MPTHDAYGRLTPYELCLPELAWARERFREVREESLGRGVDAGDPATFQLLAAVGITLREIRPREESVELLPRHGILLYHAFHFWEAGEPLFLISAPALRRLVRAESLTLWPGELPAPAGYAQLPQHLLWTSAEGGVLPESIDGFFWAAPAERGELRLLGVSVMRGERPGLSVFPLPPVSLDALTSWPELEAKEGRPDFRSRLPGAELEGLLQITTAGDLLGLAWRILACLGEGAAGEPVDPPSALGPPRPTRLPYRKVDLG